MLEISLLTESKKGNKTKINTEGALIPYNTTLVSGFRHSMNKVL